MYVICGTKIEGMYDSRISTDPVRKPAVRKPAGREPAVWSVAKGASATRDHSPRCSNSLDVGVHGETSYDESSKAKGSQTQSAQTKSPQAKRPRNETPKSPDAGDVSREIGRAHV